MAESPEMLRTSLQHFGLERDRLRTALARKLGIAETDLDALEHLEASGPLTHRQLAARLAITPGAVTMLVDRLAERGWVHRTPHPTDRRAVHVDLTPDALRDAPPALAAYHNAIRDLAHHVPPAHRPALRAFLDAAAHAAADAATNLTG